MKKHVARYFGPEGPPTGAEFSPQHPAYYLRGGDAAEPAQLLAMALGADADQALAYTFVGTMREWRRDQKVYSEIRAQALASIGDAIRDYEAHAVGGPACYAPTAFEHTDREIIGGWALKVSLLYVHALAQVTRFVAASRKLSCPSVDYEVLPDLPPARQAPLAVFVAIGPEEPPLDAILRRGSLIVFGKHENGVQSVVLSVQRSESHLYHSSMACFNVRHTVWSGAVQRALAAGRGIRGVGNLLGVVLHRGCLVRARPEYDATVVCRTPFRVVGEAELQGNVAATPSGP